MGGCRPASAVTTYYFSPTGFVQSGVVTDVGVGGGRVSGIECGVGIGREGVLVVLGILYVC